MRESDPPAWGFELRDDYVYVRRTPYVFETIDEVHAAFGWLLASLERTMNPDLGILFDLRDGPPANDDPEFQRATLPYRESFFIGYGNGAVLVNTTEGTRQLNRQSDEDNAAYRVYDDEDEAIEYVRASARDALRLRFD